MSGHDTWQRLLDLKEKSASPGHPEQAEGQREYLSMLMADNAEYWRQQEVATTHGVQEHG